MNVRLAVLADAANISSDNKLNILGVFGLVNAFAVPVQYPHMTVVLQLTASPGEKGTSHVLRLVVVDDDGKPVIRPAEMQVTVPDNLPGPDVDFNVLTNIVGVQLNKFGEYRVDVLIDGQSKAQLRFRLQAVPPPPGFPLSPPPPGDNEG
jgi:hypothetical protein